jgi:hypothetical protein
LRANTIPLSQSLWNAAGFQSPNAAQRFELMGLTFFRRS